MSDTEIDAVEDARDVAPNVQSVSDTKKWAKETSAKLKSFSYKLPSENDPPKSPAPSSNGNAVLARYNSAGAAAAGGGDVYTSRSVTHQYLPTQTTTTSQSTITKSSTSTVTTSTGGSRVIAQQSTTVTLPAVTLRHVTPNAKPAVTAVEEEEEEEKEDNSVLYVPLHERVPVPYEDLVRINASKDYQNLMKAELETYLTVEEFVKVLGRNKVRNIHFIMLN